MSETTPVRTIHELTQPEKVVVHILGILDDMRLAGIVHGGVFHLGEIGRNLFRQLQESGFHPTEDEIKAAMDTLQNLS